MGLRPERHYMVAYFINLRMLAITCPDKEYHEDQLREINEEMTDILSRQRNEYRDFWRVKKMGRSSARQAERL